jgi:hypothetical protein
MTRNERLLRRVRALTWFFIAGLIVAGATAIPLKTEVDWLVNLTGVKDSAGTSQPPALAIWLERVQAALNRTASTDPILFYGTDWLAFGHFAIALAFVGALRDPVRNRWLFTFGMIACALIVPYAMIFGAIRGIPIWWRLIDCSFGVLGFVPVWLCWKWTGELEEEVKRENHR